ncbi:MAG: Glycerol-3-phosphate acyltransferase [candidate division WS2 bacterium]|uniref:Glycerol-3-phosphate acyltransferase n=1 Tax=Psychracetigena formicireducens TaxID=2986056 RepID=A0A9E2F0J1_PSYF1|nr:Glycerol-3-phosphate acyltransferase [Candidatus Psychracetigena formicireducens]MBT9144404.1 Glycerol-3-phosphate acyltransferase [Candidatus Psychracetigena formicireducens]MBT9150462.1 Glycerol-3-phosphate acyltransferase [Candidatus Psychracetigena formicireducens]
MIYLIIGLAFFIGGLPFGYLVGKYIYKVDIRQIGSGNIGAINVVRSLGIRWGLLVLFLDLLKSFLALILFRGYLNQDRYLFLFSLLLVLGHDYSPFLNFKGGKGVATSMGIYLALAPVALIWAVPIYLLLLLVSGFPSLASLVSLLSIPLIVYLYNFPSYLVVLSIVLFLIALLRHKENILRLLEGKENCIFKR